MKITIQELSKSFGGRDIFSNFSLEVDICRRISDFGLIGTATSTQQALREGGEAA